MKEAILVKGIGIKTIFGVIGAFIVASLGGWDMALQTLISFMIIDYVSGLIVACVFKRSGKSLSGAFNSWAGLQGLIKKVIMLLMVYIAIRLELVTGLQNGVIRNTLIIGLIVNELGSIGENFGIMGVPFPSVITNAIDVLRGNKEDD